MDKSITNMAHYDNKDPLREIVLFIIETFFWALLFGIAFLYAAGSGLIYIHD